MLVVVAPGEMLVVKEVLRLLALFLRLAVAVAAKVKAEVVMAAMAVLVVVAVTNQAHHMAEAVHLVRDIMVAVAQEAAGMELKVAAVAVPVEKVEFVREVSILQVEALV